MKTFILAALMCAASSISSGQTQNPLRVAVAGLSHGHVGEITAAAQRGEVEVVGIFESDPAVRAGARLAQIYPDRVWDDLGAMLDAVRPEAAVAYGSIFDHLGIVEACAPRGVHVMVEKPLAVSGDHAREMARLAREHNIHLLTNYETSWYPSLRRAREMLADGAVGQVNRIEVYDGHEGPVEIGCGGEFLAWLTDPMLNGGGAVVDFGCYGANLATWLLEGTKPVRVSAVLKQLKPEIYPRVDDDATILLEYPGCTVQIAASWCWPMSRKDTHIYGHNGYIYQDDGHTMRTMTGGERQQTRVEADGSWFVGPFAFLTAVVRGEAAVGPNDTAALENNLTVVEILDAARQSARTGQAVQLY